MRNTPGTLIVTGGSRGIGAAVARMAAARGYAVAVNFEKDQAAAEKIVHEITQHGGKAAAIQADVAKEKDVLHLFDASEKTLGPITALVNNAGITGKFARVENVETTTLERVLAVNVIGTMLCAREAVRRFSTKRGGNGGAIVSISSRAAELGAAGEWVHYAASKGAVNTFTIGLAREVAQEGILVNAVAPGLVETEIHAAAGGPERTRRLAAGIPLGRVGNPVEIAEAVLWLLSPAASYVTGTILTVAGGR
jgi:NAD(P)-dependent dehydrogenase (short-subunit alcohol dehydrogenase family)